MNFRPLLRLTALVAASALLGACATNHANTSATGATAASPASAKTLIKQRAENRWKLLIAHQGAKAWDYLTPGYRATISREKYAAEMNGRPVRWNKASVTKVDCAAADRCTVYVMVKYAMSVPGIPNGTSFAPLQETWLHIHNQWYYLPRETGTSTLRSSH